jgi:hypothetical protein
MQLLNKYTYNICLKKIDETLGTNVCNINVQPLQHMQHPDLFLQNPYETLTTYLKKTKTLETYACNTCFQRNVILLLGRMELVLVELDVMECSEVVGAELVGGTDLGSGRDRWIECNRDERRGARRRAVARAGPAPPSGAGRVRSTSGGDTSKQSASRDGGWHRRGRRRRSPSERGGAV